MLTACSAFLRSVRKRNKVVCSIIFFLCGLALAEPLKIQVVQRGSNGDTYRIGDRIALYIEVPQSLQNQNSSFEIRPEIDEKELGKAGWYLDPQINFISGNLRFIVSPIQVGELILPTLIITNQNKEVVGKTETWKIKAVGENLTPEQENQKPEYLPPTPISLSIKIWILIIAIFVTIALVCFFLYRKWKKSVRKPVVTPTIVTTKEADDVLAIRAIQELYQKYSFEMGNLKPLAFGISEILKNYFSVRMNVDASESTSQEMLELFKKVNIGANDLQEIKELFIDLDLIKFTKPESYKHFSETNYHEFRNKAEVLIKKWAKPKAGKP